MEISILSALRPIYFFIYLNFEGLLIIRIKLILFHIKDNIFYYKMNEQSLVFATFPLYIIEDGRNKHLRYL